MQSMLITVGLLFVAQARLRRPATTGTQR